MPQFTRTVLFLILLFTSCYVGGQTSEKDTIRRNHEFSIIVDNIFSEVPGIIEKHYWRWGLYTSNTEFKFKGWMPPRVGFGYKSHAQNTAFRSKVSFWSHSLTSEDNNSPKETSEAYFTFNALLGVEFKKRNNNIQFFYGIDAFYNYYSIESEEKYERGDPTHTVTSKDIYKINGLGVSPFLGIKYFITPAFSLSTELKFFTEFLNGEDVYKFSENSEDDKKKIHGTDLRVGPLGQISFNFHF